MWATQEARLIELEQQVTEARAEARRLRRILEASDDVVSIIGRARTTTHLGRHGFEALTGIPADEHPAFENIHPLDQPAVERRFDELIASGPGARTRVEYRHRHADGSWIWFESVACNLLDDPDVHGVLVISRKNDDAVRLREALRAATERYEIAQRISHEAVWERNLLDDTMIFSPAATALVGYAADELPPTVDGTYLLLHPDDVPVQEALVQSALRGEAVADTEARVLHKSGEYRWIRIHREVQWDGERRPTRIIAHATDVHDRKVAEARLVDRSRRDAVVGRVSRLLVDGAIEAALVVIGAHFGCSVVSVRRLHPDGTIETLSAWSVDGDPTTTPPDATAMGSILDALRTEGSVVTADSLVLPLVDQRLVVGWIALDGADVEWKDSDVASGRLLAEILSMGIARSQAEARTRLTAMRDELIGEISRRFLDEDPEVALDAVLERIGTRLDFERVSVFAPDAEARRLTCSHRWRASGSDAGWESLEGYPLPPRIFEPLDGASSPSLERPAVPIDEWLATLQRDAGTRTLQVPIGYGGRVFGLLVARPRSARAWNDDDASMLRSVGEVVAVARVRRAAELALAEAKEAAVAASAAKSSFLANMSHELRTPLNGVIGMVDLLSGTRLDQHQRRYCDVARSSADALLSVINDVLDFSKIEANKLELDAAPFDLGVTITDVVEMLSLQAKRKGLELVARTPPMIHVIGDAGRVRQVLVNLVSNAIKFTSKGSVSICARVTSEAEDVYRVRVEVEDTGLGLPPDAERRLFEPFSQLDGSAARRQGGTGLGLAISRDLVERMGGAIGVTSELGRGSTFWFELSLDRAGTPAASQAASEAKEVSTSGPGPLACTRVLVVEDSPVNALVTTELLRRAGAAFELVEDGKRALEAAGRSEFDLVLMDCHLPVMDGYETARRLRALGVRTPIVALTASATPEDLARCFAAGMNDRVVKPVDARRFIELLVRHVEPKGTPDAEETRVFDAASALDRMRGDRDLFRRVCVRFGEIAPVERRTLSAAVQKRDARTVAALTHRLQGQAGALGGRLLVEALVALEAVAGDGRWTAASAALLSVESELDRLLLAITAGG